MKISVLTATYNRAEELEQLYTSLIINSNSDINFEWLIIDDGSSDNTEIIVKEWIDNESSFPVRYYKVPNGGKMRAINMGASLAKGEVFCGIDSDDWFYNVDDGTRYKDAILIISIGTPYNSKYYTC